MSKEARRPAVVIAAAALTLGTAALAAAAPGDTTLTGATTEGASVKLVVATAGNATSFKIGRTTVTCAEGGELTNRGGTYVDFDTSDPGVFDDRSKASSNNDGYHFKTKSVIHGEVEDDQRSWAGTFKLITKVFRHGDRIDVCKLKTEWSVD